MAPRKKKQPAKKKTVEEPVMEGREEEGEMEAAAAMNEEGMGVWDEDEMDESQAQKGRKGKSQNEEEDEEIRAMVDRPRLTVDAALAQLKTEEMALREFIGEMKSKRRHLQVEEERLRRALNQLEGRNDDDI